MKIKFLSLELSKYIAAGETIQRPSSVVKELIENSLDANANSITIEIKSGGIKLIRIRDNGYGIRKNELSIALKRYTSSKINKIQDLQKIKTFGFRGEALASINSISRISLISRTSKQNIGWQINSEGGKISKNLKPIYHPIGTTIEVSDLFYNIPVKKKFLKTEKTEFIHINKTIKQIMLSRFDINLLLINNGEIIKKYNFALNKKQKENRLNFILGNFFFKNKIRIKYKYKNIHLNGWICTKPTNINIKYCYVNHRLIKNKIITNTITQIQKNILNDNEKLLYLIYIKINTKNIDINVHPSKLKINFKNPLIIYHIIYNALIKKLKIRKNKKINNKSIKKNQEKYKKNNINNNFKTEKKIINKSFNKLYIKKKIIKSQKIKLLTIIKKKYAIIEYQKNFFLINLMKLIKILKIKQLNLLKKKKIKKQIIPIRLNIKKYELKTIKKNKNLLKKIGISLYENNKNIVIYKTPIIITKEYKKFLIKLIIFINKQKNINFTNIFNWFKYSFFKIPKYLNYKKITEILKILQKNKNLLKKQYKKIKFLTTIKIKKYINKIKN